MPFGLRKNLNNSDTSLAVQYEPLYQASTRNDLEWGIRTWKLGLEHSERVVAIPSTHRSRSDDTKDRVGNASLVHLDKKQSP